MPIVYLDQNKWIDLARIQNGLTTDEVSRQTLETIRVSVESGHLVLPLSSVHYMELAHIKNLKRRKRLGDVMGELSRGTTMADNHAILVNELELALARRFPHVTPRPFKLLSTGVSHAFGREVRTYRIRPEIRATMSEEDALAHEAKGNATIQRSLLTGEAPPGVAVKRFGRTEAHRNFQRYLDSLRARLEAELEPDRWEDALHALSIVDIKDVLNEVFAAHGLTVEHLTPPGSEQEALTAFMEEIPSRRIDRQLHRQRIRNPELRAKLNDLEDFSGLVPAAAHCDVLVCEKHFADLLLRDGFQPKARVLTDLRELPAVLKL